MKETEALGVRERILDLAASLFVAQGYDGISMREIAEACQLSKAGLYYHFKDKEDLFLEILSTNLAELEILLRGIAAQQGSAREKIGAFIHNVFIQMPANRRAIIRLASQDMGKLQPVVRADFDRQYQEKFLNHLARWLEEGAASGELRSMDPYLGTWALLGLMYPFFNQNASNPEEQLKIVRLIETVFFEGMRTSGQSGKHTT